MYSPLHKSALQSFNMYCSLQMLKLFSLVIMLFLLTEPHLCFPYQEQVNKQSYNEKSDIWSLGCLVYELCALSPPFTAMNQRSLEAKIRVGKFRPIPEQYSQELSETVNSMLRVNVRMLPVGLSHSNDTFSVKLSTKCLARFILF